MTAECPNGKKRTFAALTLTPRRNVRKTIVGVVFSNHGQAVDLSLRILLSVSLLAVCWADAKSTRDPLPVWGDPPTLCSCFLSTNPRRDRDCYPPPSSADSHRCIKIESSTDAQLSEEEVLAYQVGFRNPPMKEDHNAGTCV